MRALLIAVAMAAFASPVLSDQALSSGRERRLHASSREDVDCPRWEPQRSSRAASHRGAQHAAKPKVKKARRKAPARKSAQRAFARAAALPMPAAWPPAPASVTYAVQLKEGLTKAQRDAAVATLRGKYNLRIVKTTRSLDLLRVTPRTPQASSSPPPRSIGEALAPQIIKDLRKEPFVDAAYVDFPVTPKAAPRPAGKHR